MWLERLNALGDMIGYSPGRVLFGRATLAEGIAVAPHLKHVGVMRQLIEKRVGQAGLFSGWSSPKPGGSCSCGLPEV